MARKAEQSKSKHSLTECLQYAQHLYREQKVKNADEYALAIFRSGSGDEGIAAYLMGAAIKTTSFERTRAHSFRAALVALRESCDHLIAWTDYDLADDLSSEAIERISDRLGSSDEAINVFDDAVECVVYERNSYVSQQGLGIGDASYKVKD